MKNRYIYPDVVIVCGEPILLEDAFDTLTNPHIIIEVLSDSTEKRDRGVKFQAAWKLDSLKAYVLVSQHESRVEYFVQQDEKTWQLRIYTKPDDALDLPSVGVSLPLSAIYRDVDFDADPD